MNTDLFLEILAMDSYNRDYEAGIKITGNSIGNANIILRSSLGISDPDYQNWQSSGFYAGAYDWNGQTVISYRGTDNADPRVPASDFWNGWTIGGGFNLASQANLAEQFYKSVTGLSSVTTSSANTILTGHSLGGGLAANDNVKYIKAAA